MVQDEDQHNKEPLALSEQILELTKEVRALAGRDLARDVQAGNDPGNEAASVGSSVTTHVATERPQPGGFRQSVASRRASRRHHRPQE
jgi:hypothetical protein